MNRKLTLLLDDTTIKNAKRYAQKRRQSLSQLVETYFQYLTKTNRTAKRAKSSSPSIVDQLSGIITLPKQVDPKTEYREFRARKALRG